MWFLSDGESTKVFFKDFLDLQIIEVSRGKQSLQHNKTEDPREQFESRDAFQFSSSPFSDKESWNLGGNSSLAWMGYGWVVP